VKGVLEDDPRARLEVEAEHSMNGEEQGRSALGAGRSQDGPREISRGR
jgi:hypothetical protein